MRNPHEFVDYGELSTLGISEQGVAKFNEVDVFERGLPEDSTEVEAVEVTEAIDEQDQDSQSRGKFKDRLKAIGMSAIITAEVLPINEAMRYGAASAAYVATKDPIVAGAVLGGTTAVIEGGAGHAMAHAYDSGAADKTVRKVHKFLDRRIGIRPDKELSKVTRASITLMGGTAISMTAQQIKNPDRTKEENKKFATKSAAALAGFCAVQGYLSAKSLYVPGPKEIGVAGAVLASGIAVAGNVVGKVKYRHNKADMLKLFGGINHRSSKNNIVVGLVSSEEAVGAARELEQSVWDENKFGSLEVYDKYVPQSRFFATFKHGKCVGATRMIGSSPELPPFAAELPIDEDRKVELSELIKNGDIEEVGTAAVDHEASGVKRGVISVEMWRLAFRDARERGVKKWGIIMEPERVEKMNKKYGFTFEQIGPSKYYQGGDCAAFIMDLDEVDVSMRKRKPIKHFWFTKKKLKGEYSE